MENPLFSLKSIIDIWLSSSSTSWAIAIILTVLCGLGFFFMLLAYLQSNPSLLPARKHGSIKKGGACRDCLKELEEARGLVLLVQSHLDRLHDKGGFHQLSRQDLPGKWWKVIQALLFPTSSQPECQQERLSHHPLEDSPWGALTDRQMGTCGVSFPAFQNEAQSLIPTKIHLEFSLLQKQLERERALPSVVKRSEEVFCQLIPNLPQDSGASHTHKSVSTLPGDFISSNLQKQHLQKRLITDEHHSVLPQGIQVSLELMRLQEEFLVAYQAQGKQAPSRPSAFADKGSKDTQKMGSRHPRKSHGQGQVKLQLGKDFSKGLGQCLQRIPEDLSRGSASFPVKVLGMNSEESEKHLLRPSKSDSGNCLPRGPDEKHLEKVLEVHLGRKSIQIKEGLIPVSVRRSWLAANYAFPKSHTHTETGNPASLKGQEPAVNTSCGHSILSPHTRQVLEAHITKLRVLHKWGLPLKVLKPIKLLKLKKAKSSQWAGARAAESPARGERAPPPGRREQGRRPPPPPAVWDPALSGARHSGGGAQPMVGPVLVRPGRRPRVRNPTRPRDGRGEARSRSSSTPRGKLRTAATSCPRSGAEEHPRQPATATANEPRPGPGACGDWAPLPASPAPAPGPAVIGRRCPRAPPGPRSAMIGHRCPRARPPCEGRR
ncbi:spermatogenesis-associated protein 31A6-like [Equus asinus]|uniref:spermatogenesis-associated protein 31A6-like n=1 Tax=Equus asinus TaxID=9793 RepID=UPI0038F6D09E